MAHDDPPAVGLGAPPGRRAGGHAHGDDGPAGTHGRTGGAGDPAVTGAGRRPGRGIGFAGRMVAAAAGGLGQYAAFPPVNWWPLAPVGVALVLLAVRGARVRVAALLGFVSGLGLMVPLLPWLTHIGVDAWLGLSVAEALYFALLGAALAAVARLPGWAVWSAALWVAQEALRTRFPLGGFSWGRLAFAETGAPYLHLASLVGATGVTFAVALTGGLLACAAVWAARSTRLRPAERGPAAYRGSAAPNRLAVRPGPVAGSLVLAAVVVAGAGAAVPLERGHVTGRVAVAVVQGDVPRPGMHFLGRREQVLDNHVHETEKLAAQIEAGKISRPDLVIWPENSSDLDPYRNPAARASIGAAARAVGAPILVGGVTLLPDGKHVQNRGIVWQPGRGPGEYYVAQHLVPFGEQIPYRDFLSRFIKRLRMVPYNYQSGDRPGLLRIGKMRIGDVICFEWGFDPVARGTVRAGARMLVDQTNDATYGRGAEPAQQFAMVRLRAVEHDRAIAVASTTGISAIVARDGAVRARTREFVPALLSATLPQVDSLTMADRLRGGPEWTLTVLGVGALIVAAARRKRRGT